MNSHHRYLVGFFLYRSVTIKKQKNMTVLRRVIILIRRNAWFYDSGKKKKKIKK